MDFFTIDPKLLAGATSFQILKSHYCTDIAIYRGDYEVDLFIPFFNAIFSKKRVAIILQKERLVLGKKEVNVFISEGEEAGNISFYSLFMFFVNLYCFDEEQTLEVRAAFEAFVMEKGSEDLFFYFLLAFKKEIPILLKYGACSGRY